MYNTSEVAETIKEVAKNKGYSIAAMLKECGLGKDTINTMARRGSWIQADSLAKIADCLDCSVDYLLGRETNMNVENNGVGHIVNNGVNNGFMGDNYTGAKVINGNNKGKENSRTQSLSKFNPDDMDESASVTCGYCGTMFALTSTDNEESTFNQILFNHRGSINLSFDEYNGVMYENLVENSDKTYSVALGRCPSCGKDTICIYEYEKDDNAPNSLRKVDTCLVKPFSNPIHFPDYVPQQIRQDYEEACAIAKLSANAAAVLLRRCLQLMIRDFWKIDKYNLGNAFKALKKEHEEEISDYEVLINALIESGDTGAHPNEFEEQIANVEHIYVEFLINCTEQLIEDWYLKKHEKDKQQFVARAIVERFKSTREAYGNTKKTTQTDN